MLISHLPQFNYLSNLKNMQEKTLTINLNSFVLRSKNIKVSLQSVHLFKSQLKKCSS